MQGIAPGGGLFMPERIPGLPAGFFERLPELSFPELSWQVARTFLDGAVPDEDLKEIVYDAINFDAPLVPLSDHLYSLELFHGPTLAFKDFGARFLARTVAWLNTRRRQDRSRVTVLVATSGDTGSAVAHGFYKVPGVRVCLLYPSGKVSHIQEQQLTTLGENITAFEVNGTFDDCQRMVKEAFADRELSAELGLTSANSINIARLMPQMFYYFHAYARLKDRSLPLVFSVPSGNFGNLTAGLLAREMGLPVHRFVASTNVNDVVPEYLRTGAYRPRPSIATISNAMDVGAPNNFDRLARLFLHDHEQVKERIYGCSFTDEDTKNEMKRTDNQYGYMLDPHGSVAIMGLNSYLNKYSSEKTNGVFLETAHPAKFKEVVEETLGKPLALPERLAVCMEKTKQSTRIGAEFAALRKSLLDLGD